ncbi:hypothetical protein ABQF34_12490 [Mycolicibacterium boenickei]
MHFKKLVGVSAAATGIGLAGWLGVGVGTAGADPGPGCDRPGTSCDHRDDRGPQPDEWHDRGIDQGRRDHQPFDWNGQRVTPVPAGNGHGWGFWFLGTWIPL